jgi:hypothetical protein
MHIEPAVAGAEPIVVNVAPTEVKVEAGGQPVEVVASVRNATTTVDQYSIELENLDPSWYTITVQSVSLFPGDSAPIPIRLHPPKGSATRAGNYTFIVRARSHSDPTMVGVTKGVLQVGSYSIFQVELAPKKMTAYRGKYRLTLSNGGNNEVQLDLEGRDPESDLNYSFRGKQPTVQPGSRLVVPVTVKRRGVHWVGQPRRYQFAITARPVDGEEKDAKEVVGELIQKPYFRGLRGPLLGLLAMLLILFLISPSFISLCLLPVPYPLNQLTCSYNSFFTGLFKGSTSPTPAAAAGTTQTPQSGAPAFQQGFAKCHDASAANAKLIGDPLNSEQNFDNYGNARQSTTNGTLIFVRASPQSTEGDIYFISNKKLYYCTLDSRLVEVQKP